MFVQINGALINLNQVAGVYPVKLTDDKSEQERDRECGLPAVMFDDVPFQLRDNESVDNVMAVIKEGLRRDSAVVDLDALLDAQEPKR
jgi:hypothetical protein